MKISEVLSSPWKEGDITEVQRHLHSLGESLWFDDDTKLKMVQVRVHLFHNFDHRRCLKISSLWYGGIPVMVFHESGREGRDDEGRYILSKSGLIEAIRYLRSRAQIETDLIEEQLACSSQEFSCGYPIVITDRLTIQED